MSDCAAAVTASLDAYRFDEAANRLYQFLWGTYCDWYLEFTKPILQGDDAAARTETQTMTAWVLGRMVDWLGGQAPERLWGQAQTPLWDIDWAVAELERSRKQHDA